MTIVPGPILRASRRGHRVPLDGFAGHVVAVTRCAVYVTDSTTMIVLRDARTFVDGTLTATTIVAPCSLHACATADGVRIVNGVLHHRAFAIDVRDAVVWCPPALDGVDARTALRRVKSLPVPPFDHALRANIHAFIDALGPRDATSARRAARALVGAGPGLTPSGDDALVGALAVLWRTDSTAHQTAADAIVDQLHRTTVVGAHLLHAASEGSFAQPVLAFVDALLTPIESVGAERRAQHALAVLVGIGATTGVDTIVGAAVAVAWLSANACVVAAP